MCRKRLINSIWKEENCKLFWVPIQTLLILLPFRSKIYKIDGWTMQYENCTFEHQTQFTFNHNSKLLSLLWTNSDGL